MSLTLRSTEAGERFVRQFDAADQATASSFVDSLSLVSHDEFRAGVVSILRRLSAESSRPLALFAARERDGPGGTPYFDTENRELRPSAVGKGAKVGSEGVVANLVRDIAAECGAGKALDHPHIESMRATKARRIVIVDDIIGSGKRMRNFVRWLSADKTIRSWLSYGLMRFVPVAFAATEMGRNSLLRSKYVSEVLYGHVAGFGRGSWSRRDTDGYLQLCKHYASRTSRPMWPLGYADAMTMLVFQHKCPNTTPAIVWAESKEWNSIIQRRPDFSFDEWPANIEEKDRVSQTLKSLNQKTLSETQWMKFVSTRARFRFLILSALLKRRMNEHFLSSVVGVSVDECVQLIRECVSFGWLSGEGRVTEQGRAELVHAGKLGLVHEESVGLTDDIYVPQSFRGASG